MKKLTIMNGIYPRISQLERADAEHYYIGNKSSYIYYLDGSHAYLEPIDDYTDFDTIVDLLDNATDGWAFIDKIDAEILMSNGIPWINI